MSSLAAQASAGHLQAALCRLDALLARAVDAARTAFGPEATKDPYRGLHVSDREAERLLARPPGTSFLFARPEGATSLVGAECRAERLRGLFGLSEFDLDALLIAIAPDIDPRYERLYGYLQDDVTKKRPTVDLILNLLCDSLEARLRARRCFSADGPLVAHRLVALIEDPSQRQAPLLARYVKVDDRVVEFLVGSDAVDARLVPHAAHVVPERGFDQLIVASDLRNRVRLLLRRRDRLVLYFQGPYGVGKQAMAEALCRELGCSLVVVDGAQLAHAAGQDLPTTIGLAFREAVLQEAVLYWKGFDALLVEDRRTGLDALLRILGARAGLTVLAGDAPWEPADLPSGVTFVRIELPRPSHAERAQLWSRALAADAAARADLEVDSLAGKFRLTGGQIRDAVATACGLARWREPEHGELTMDVLYAACRLQSNRKLGTLARKISSHYRWDDIILPPDRLQQLREICNCVKYRALVYDAWGFDRKVALGKGLNVLFAGPSGTGKTMAADIMAGELGLDLYKIDLSTVVSKYIGETEKNLARIFEEAETSNAILFFDEADALFGKRSEVRDAHDRYANIEINYLLQKMEEHEGMTILASNFRKNMDEAFVRRLHFAVEFPLPNEADRRRIWERTWPAEVPQDASVDMDFMARRFEIAGGNIKNIALAAAFLAAADDGPVRMEHLLHGTRREYQKMGKVLGEGAMSRMLVG